MPGCWMQLFLYERLGIQQRHAALVYFYNAFLTETGYNPGDCLS